MASISQQTQPILVLGAGELGTAIIHSLTSHPSFSIQATPISLLVRPETLASPSAEKKRQLDHFRNDLSLSILPCDLENDSLSILTSVFAPFYTVIHAGGMTMVPGTVTKVTKAVLAAGVKLYLPWQYGVDYDVIGPDGGMGLFAEQCAVRQLLRSQERTGWVIVSCGIFMSFLFEQFWGVVSTVNGKIKVTALNSWDNVITVTSAEDIGRCVTELILDPAGNAPRGQPVYIAGDTLTYKQFADTVERESGGDVVRDIWPLEYLRERMRTEPDNKLAKYRVVFAEGKGLSWPMGRTWNRERGIQLEGVENWVRRNMGSQSGQ